jgi:hypothetical protein
MELDICVLPGDAMLHCTIWGGCYIIASVGTSPPILFNSPGSHAKPAGGVLGLKVLLLVISTIYPARGR